MITGLFKLIFNLIRLAIFALIFVLIFHTWTIKQALKFSLSWTFGADVSIETVKMDWKNTGFEAHGIEIENPRGFSPPGLLADIPLAIVSVDVPALLQGTIHLKAVGINLRNLQVLHSPGQGLNVMELKPLKGKEPQDEQQKSFQTMGKKVKSHASEIKIDELIVSIGDITFIELLGGMEKQKRIHIGIQGATYYDLNGINDITYVIVAPALKKLGFSFFSNQLKRFGADYAKTAVAGGFWDQVKNALTS